MFIFIYVLTNRMMLANINKLNVGFESISFTEIHMLGGMLIEGKINLPFCA